MWEMDGKSLEVVGRETPAPGTFGGDTLSWAVTVCDMCSIGGCAKNAFLKFQPKEQSVYHSASLL